MTRTCARCDQRPRLRIVDAVEPLAVWCIGCTLAGYAVTDRSLKLLAARRRPAWRRGL